MCNICLLSFFHERRIEKGKEENVGTGNMLPFSEKCFLLLIGLLRIILNFYCNFIFLVKTIIFKRNSLLLKLKQYFLEWHVNGI